MAYINERSFYIDIYIDIGDDTICLCTRFRFETTDLVKQFIKHFEKSIYILSSDIYSEISRSSSITRPRFTDINVAIEDYKKCIDYCYEQNPDKKYKYEDTITQQPLNDFMYIFLQKENEILHNENKQLRENKKLHEDNKQLHEDNKELREEYHKLQEEYHKLREEYHKLQEEYHKLQ